MHIALVSAKAITQHEKTATIKCRGIWVFKLFANISDFDQPAYHIFGLALIVRKNAHKGMRETAGENSKLTEIRVLSGTTL